MSAGSTPISVFDYEELAEKRLETGAHGYFAGGAGDEATLRDNVAAWGRWILRPRLLVDVETCTTATTVLGQEVSMPLLVAPVAFQRLVHPDGEVAMARAARDAGTIMCFSSLATSTLEEVAAVGGPRWFQVYVWRDEGLTRELVARARDQGFSALALTIDAPVRGLRERDLRSSFALPDDIRVDALGRGGLTPGQIFDLISPAVTWLDLQELAGEAGLPILVKGVLTAEDARLACEHGAAGVVVSNHGGRQLDGVAATADVLPEVVEAVDGRLEVLVDGGIRRGADVVRALALGARAVLAGRAPLWGLAVDGEAGARDVLRILQSEILNALQLVGATSPAGVARSRVARPLL
jgi:isopentenyl diphosphate isomerase/L-lactate dehydrogenase-like FMN-dependent dehydrogenase